MISAQQGRFENQKSLQDYADAHDLTYVWEGMRVSPSGGGWPS